MTRHLLGIAVRRSWGLYAVPALLAVELFSAFSRDRTYAYGWTSAADWSGSSLALVGPLLLAVGAAESVVAHRSSADDLVRSTVHGSHALVSLRSLALGLYASVCHLVGTLVIVAATLGHAGWHRPPSLPILVPFIACFAFAALGESLGTLLPFLVVPALLAVGCVILRVYLLLEGGGDLLIETGGGTGNGLGLRHRSTVMLLQASWFLLVIAIAIAVLPVIRTPGWSGKLVPGAVAATAAISVAIALAHVDNRFTLVSSLTLVCRSEDPQVCVVAGYDDYLPQATELVSESVAVLSEIDDDVPKRWEQETAVDPEPATGYFWIGAGYELSPSGVARNIVWWSLDCPPAKGARKARAQFQRSELIVAWMGTHLGFGVYLPPGTDPPTEENARQALTELQTCP